MGEVLLVLCFIKSPQNSRELDMTTLNAKSLGPGKCHVSHGSPGLKAVPMALDIWLLAPTSLSYPYLILRSVLP